MSNHSAMNCAKMYATGRISGDSNALCELRPSLATEEADPPSSCRPQIRGAPNLEEHKCHARLKTN